MLSDFWPHGETGSKFGVFQEDGANVRGTFAIDPDGIIRFVYTGPRTRQRTRDDFREALKVLTGVRAAETLLTDTPG